MIYLLDTNILSEPSRVKPDPNVSRRLMEPDLRLVTASVVWLELWSGFHRLETGRRKSKVKDYLESLLETNLMILPYTQRCAEIQAALASSLAQQGKTLPVVDAMIAGTALANDLILVTRNVADFQNIPKLQIENWFQPPAH